MASKWLKKNSNNRTVSKWVVQNYARQMRENKWQLNGEAIMLDAMERNTSKVEREEVEEILPLLGIKIVED